ncbi:MAG: lytic transglycosylase domain-containing protein [Acidimicrobiia bacterium]|nr:lytic transglycosylase domain-containing protein [Acidimicrobiia bacterium]
MPPATNTTTAPTTTTTAPPTTLAPTTTTTAPPAPPAALAPIIAGGPAVASGDPVVLADQIAQAELTIRDPAAPTAWLMAAGRLQQVAYRALATHAEWDDVVLGRLPASLVEPASRQAAARREFRSMHSRLSDNLPAWRIAAPLPADELLGYYREAEAQFGVPWNVLAAVNLVETGMGRIVGLSSAGAQGPMQFIPGTWAAYGLGGDVWNHRDAIMGAANYLAANGGDRGTLEGMNNALFRYNNDNRYVRGVLQYASVMAQDPRTYYGFHAWEIVFLSSAGDIVLPVGYESYESIPVAAWLAANPQP